MSKKILKWAAISCTHAPLQDDTAVALACRELESFKPDVFIHVGDLFEADYPAKFDNERGWELEDELKAANTLLKQFHSAVGDAKKVLLIGNHDDNILGNGRIHPKIRSLANFLDPEKRLVPELLDHWEIGAKYVYNREVGTYRIGQATFCHGFEAGTSSDEYQAYQLGVPFGISVFGHTHRPVPVTQAMRTKTVSLPYWYTNVGTLSHLESMNYMDRKRRALWGQGIVLGESMLWRYEASMLPNSKLWDAETKIFRMYDSYGAGENV